MSNTAGQACRTCRFYDLPAVQDKAGRVRKDRVAMCLWELVTPLPDSVRREYRTIHTHYMGPDDGTTCPTWEKKA